VGVTAFALSAMTLAACNNNNNDAPQLASANMLAITTEAAPRVVGFDRANPSVLLSTATLTGLAVNESVIGMDIRPSDSLIFVAARLTGAATGTLYTLNSATGALTAFCTLATLAPVPATANQYGVDFNPTNGGLRIVSNAATANNLAATVPTASPGAATACAVATQGDLAVTDIAAAAYTNSVSGTPTGTILYYISSPVGANAILRRTLTPTAPTTPAAVGTNLGIQMTAANPAASLNGFQISGNTDVATFVTPSTLNAVDATRVYAIGLANGNSTLLGTLGNGTFGVAGLTSLTVGAP
jgi:hypothetical protein